MAYRMIWEVEVTHEGLGKYRHIRGSDPYVVEQKAAYQKQQWDEQWQRKLQADLRAQERQSAVMQRSAEKERSASEKAKQKEEAQRYKEERAEGALERDTEAKKTIEALKNVLNHTLNINDAIDWNKIKDKSSFKELPPKLVLTPAPENQSTPAEPHPADVPPEPKPAIRPAPPKESAEKYQPTFGFLDRFFTSRKAGKVKAAEEVFIRDYAAYTTECKKLDEQDANELMKWDARKGQIESQNASTHADWARTVERIKTENQNRRAYWEKSCENLRAEHDKAVKEWEQRREKFYEQQKLTNAAIDKNHQDYLTKDQGAVLDYCDSVLCNSIYPDYFPKEWDLDYNAETRTLVVEYDLPAPEAMPTLKEVQYVQSKDSFKETHLTEKEKDALYDNLLYQIALRTIHELFEADTAEALDAVAFNGIVTAVDKTSGHKVTACILSVMCRKEAFMQINLAGIDPKACFKNLKGVAASKLSGLSSVPPIMMIDKEDRRFIEGYGVVGSLNEGTNLATMNWEDFEHLIRELFEQEFLSTGGEVKVTQASRDGGVDAVAFDPDPIRGGKIVIQAKRYANTVGVSAVRDLYGTVMNEGAIKGILVTTADYGPDAYEFAKGKPLTLLNGSNLLHLLEKHGHKARINLNEAKQEARAAYAASLPI